VRTPADPAQTQRHRSAIGPVCLAISSLLLLVFPLVRPFTDRTGTPAEVAATFASTSWVAAHILAGLGFVLLPVGLLAVSEFLRDTHVERLAAQGLIVSWIGIGLILPTAFGTEPFALRAIGQAAIRQENMDLLVLAMSIRMGSQARFLFPGLLVLAIGAVLIAVAVWRSGALPRWSGVLFALGLAMFFPLFPRAIRVVDGLLIGVGGVWIALSMLRHRGRNETRSS
jgi:hypothetical protein